MMSKNLHRVRVFLAFILAVSFLFTPKISQAASKDAIFVNLSDTTVWIARYTFQRYRPARSSIPAGDYNLPAAQPEQPAGWRFEGWWTLRPGDAKTFSVGEGGWFYLENSRNPVTWSGRKKSPGYVRNPKAFNTFISKSGWSTETRRLVRQGYRKVNFQYFTAGRWTVSGSAYRVVRKEFSFRIRSRDPKYKTLYFRVPGHVVDYAYSARKWRAENVSWYKQDTSIKLMAYVSGKQKRIGGPREPGYYQGKLTVYYTVRR